eukprot:TRINITY_DN11617_c0_g1_i1.p1 TRINITY_DN11617_c0_g1~~TRINITY_DN11617_c0_g1_i1.p1  ORF type:complete len:561 (+),score=49.10 TRINITY_DN11617_c0_g1_i1:168-1685(+)
MAVDIYQLFLQEHAKFGVNISHRLREMVRDLYENMIETGQMCEHLFNEIMSNQLSLLSESYYHDFLDSDKYKEHIQETKTLKKPVTSRRQDRITARLKRASRTSRTIGERPPKRKMSRYGIREKSRSERLTLTRLSAKLLKYNSDHEKVGVTHDFSGRDADIHDILKLKDIMRIFHADKFPRSLNIKLRDLKLLIKNVERKDTAVLNLYREPIEELLATSVYTPDMWPDRLMFISFIDCNLRSIPDLSALVNLERLNVIENLIHEIPDHVCQMHSLILLKISMNNLSDINPNISKLGNLETLNLSGNLIAKLPNSMKRLKSLSNLILNKNKFRTMPKVLAKIKSLRNVLLDGNNIIYIPDCIGSMKNLRSISFLKNGDIIKLPWTIAKLENLEDLYLEKDQCFSIGSSVKGYRLSGRQILSLLEWLQNHNANIAHFIKHGHYCKLSESYNCSVCNEKLNIKKKRCYLCGLAVHIKCRKVRNVELLEENIQVCLRCDQYITNFENK